MMQISCKAGAARCSIRWKDPPKKGGKAKGRRLTADGEHATFAAADTHPLPTPPSFFPFLVCFSSCR